MVTNKKSKFTLGGINFRIWGDVQEHARKILSRGYQEFLSDYDHNFVMDLLEYHPRREKKIKDVSHIKVDIAEKNSSHYCFFLVDNQGNSCDFSYKKCTAKTKKDKSIALYKLDKQDRISAYRQAIQYQIDEYLSLSKNKKCCICESRENIQVDHNEKTFISILNSFEHEYRIISYPTVEDYKCIHGFRFKKDEYSNEFIENWQQYHKNNATLQILCRTCNLTKLGNDRYKPYSEK